MSEEQNDKAKAAEEATEMAAADTTPKDETAPSTDLPSCKCGYTREDVKKVVYVEPKGEWDAWGWFSLLWGVTAKPKKVNFYCSKCRITFDSSVDPEILRQNM